MKPRDIVFDLIGEHPESLGGGARLQALTDLLGGLGVGEETARITLARMRTEGWFAPRRDGRTTRYIPTDACRRLVAERRATVSRRRRDAWDGQWRMVIYRVALPDRPERERLRQVLTRLRFGPLTAATWVSPHPVLADVEAELGPVSALRFELLTCRTWGPGGDRDMAARCWDLPAIDREAARLLDRLDELPAPDALRALPGEEALRLRIELSGAVRSFAARDPDLPAQLLPGTWAGQRAHLLFEQAHEALDRPARAFVEAVVQRHGGAAAHGPATGA